MSPGVSARCWRAWDVAVSKSDYATQFDVLLQENEVEKALQLWPHLDHWDRNKRHDQLSKAAEKSSVDDGLLLWLQLAESLIAHKSRDAYRMAAKALLRAKKSLEAAGRGTEWPQHAAALRTRYPALRALKEELDKLKL